MIEKSRLQELIDEWAIVYTLQNNKVVWCALDNKMYCDDEILYLEDKDDGEILYLKDIFETFEDAEWHKEFGCIERTERLELPTWEEWEETGCFGFTSANGEPLVIEKIITFDFDNKNSEDYIGITDVRDYDHNMLFKEILTKGNYTLACRKAKELFLGEKE